MRPSASPSFFCGTPLTQPLDARRTAGYHIGEEPDERSVETCRKHGVPINSLCRQLEGRRRRSSLPSLSLLADRLARRPQKSDFTRFDYIVGMDSMNMRNIEKAKPKNSTAKSASSSLSLSLSLFARARADPRRPCSLAVALFGDFGDGKQIADPYYGGPGGFEKTYQQCVSYSEGLLRDMGFEEGKTDGKL